MSVLLVRHAYAGDSAKWVGDDRFRPLEGVGWRQASGLVELLAPYELERIVSSPYLRCVQSVEPLAEARGIPIEHDEALGADRLDDVPGVLERLEGQNAAVCTHGDLAWLGDRAFKKGSVWVLEGGAPATYLPPPA
jgi:8-oxo-dGTP diphosphatase